jgi:hypothetical protein
MYNIMYWSADSRPQNETTAILERPTPSLVEEECPFRKKHVCLGQNAVLIH